jgi:hypothetical protein
MSKKEVMDNVKKISEKVDDIAETFNLEIKAPFKFHNTPY